MAWLISFFKRSHEQCQVSFWPVSVTWWTMLHGHMHSHCIVRQSFLSLRFQCLCKNRTHAHIMAQAGHCEAVNGILRYFSNVSFTFSNGHECMPRNAHINTASNSANSYSNGFSRSLTFLKVTAEANNMPIKRAKQETATLSSGIQSHIHQI